MAVTLHVALDPRDPAPADVAIVVDCIRATTTISHALDTGYASVTCVGEIDDAHAERAEGALLGGGRGHLHGGGLIKIIVRIIIIIITIIIRNNNYNDNNNTI